MEFNIILVICGIFIYLIKFKAPASVFELDNESVIFGKRRLLYSNIIKIEKDIVGDYEVLNTMYLGYLITYIDESGNIDNFRFSRSVREKMKWELLKSNILSHNPSARFNESIW